MIGRRFKLCIAAALVLAAACAAPQPEAQGTPFAELMAKAEEMGAVRVIVRVAGDEAQMPQMQSAAVATFSAAGVESAEPLTARLPYVVAEVTPSELRRLYSNPRFDVWTEDRVAFPTLAESGPLVQAPQLHALGGRGAGQSVAILDTGVDANHPFLAGRVAVEACFSTTSTANRSTSVCPNSEREQTGAGAARPCAASGCEHGTHVAGIAAGRGTDFSGMAPDADIIAVQVFSQFRGLACGGQPSPCTASFTSDQIRALDFVLQQQTGGRAVAAVNMSLGGGRAESACDEDATKPVIDQLRAAGVATAIASGNDGFSNAVSFPGCISTAVTVGATDDRDRVASFSNRGPQVDLHAPGVAITSSIPSNRFAAFDGTSMATPHVAGAFAALRSLHPDASLDQIEAALRSTGVDTGGRPRIRLLDAANALAAAPAPAQPAQAPTGSPAMQSALAQLNSMPADQPVRLIVGVTAAPGQTQTAALARAESAVRSAGANYVGPMGSQSMLVIEATPAQARAIASSGAISSLQIDRTMRPQN